MTDIVSIANSSSLVGLACAPSSNTLKGAIKILSILLAAGTLLILAGYGARHAAKRLWLQIPFTQTRAWNTIIEQRKNEFSAQPWRDSHPLNVLAGDSHIEFGNWYQDCQGAFAIRNCGLASAGIENVADLLTALKEPRIETLLLLCGINNLGRDETPSQCLEKYENLLDQARALAPQKIIAVSVMPLRQSFADPRSREINARVRGFNTLLKALCEQRSILYLDVTAILTDANGGLIEKFTEDGLHLNPKGYARITPEICKVLSRN